MIDLHDKDIIEYELKMGQLRTQVERQKSIQDSQNQSSKQNQITCPKCGCTEFVPLRRKFSLLTGFATNKVDMVCKNCGWVRK